VALGALAAVLAGCSGGGSSGGSASPPTPPLRVSPPGPFFGECGNVTDDEVAQAMAQPKFPVVFRNSVGCVWQSDGTLQTPSVSFSWYRGSPIGREAAGSALIGRPPDWIQIDGHKAFRGSLAQQLCEIGVQYGDDFFHWSVSFGEQDATADPCDVAAKLANLTASRVK
jgi:hypothetical protein